MCLSHHECSQAGNDGIETYNSILAAHDLEPELLEVHVDDGHQVGAIFQHGTRFDPTTRMCKPPMNFANEDLVFTVNVQEDFPDNFKLWMEGNEDILPCYKGCIVCGKHPPQWPY